MRLLLPLLLALLGTGAGVGAGFVLRPPPQAAEGAAPDAGGAEGVPRGATSSEAAFSPGEAPTKRRDRPPLAETEFVRLSSQFIVPVVRGGRVASLVVLSLSLETGLGMSEVVFAREPKLRDAFLQVLFDYANAGGFDGNFTEARQIRALRQGLWEAARPVLGPSLYDVLITDIARQDR